MSSPIDSSEVRTRLKRLEQYRRESLGKTTAQLTVEWADSVLKSPIRIEPMSALATECGERMAELRRTGKSGTTDEARAKQRRWQYDRWLADVNHEIWTHGIRLLEELEKHAPGDTARLNAVSARVATLLASLRAQNFPWWPVRFVDADHRELSLLEYCEVRLGQLETQQIRRAGRGALPSRASGMDASNSRRRADVDDVSLDDWRPIEPIV